MKNKILQNKIKKPKNKQYKNTNNLKLINDHNDAK